MGNKTPVFLWFLAAAAALTLIVGVACINNIYESVDANEVAIIQSSVAGNLKCYTTAGVKPQWFGKVTKYQKRDQFWFAPDKANNGQPGKSISVRFNDGAHADVFGSVAWELPLDETRLTELHSKYGSMEAIEQQLIRPTIEKCIYMTGPLMSSAESYASRRNELISLIDDQIKYGVFKTESHDDRQKDPITGQDKTIRVVRLIPSNSSEEHGFKREDESSLAHFGIQTFNLALTDVKYDTTVENQIQAQQQSIMEVQTAIANSKKAEQNALTTAKQGEADAAKAKWEQEVIKAKEVTSAEQRKAVAELDLKTAELTKQKEILIGEGEAKRRQLVMEADGALDKKLQAMVEINRMYADAIKGYGGSWVPSISMGGTSGNGSNGAMDLISLFTAKAAKDLAVDLAPTPHRPQPPTNR